MTESLHSARRETGSADSGLDEAVIRRLICAFYDSVKTDAVLGPVFADIVNDWDSHIDKVCSFWLYALRLSRDYNSRDFIPVHMKHPSIQASLAPRWLALFRRTAYDLCDRNAAERLIDIAQRMAQSIEMSLTRRDEAPDGFGMSSQR